MNYYYDTEFLEGTQTKRFLGIPYGETLPTIDLISIGIISEDNREYYAISKDFNLKEAWNRYDLVQQSDDSRNIYPEGRKVYWIRENVLKPIYDDLFERIVEDDNMLTGDEYVYFNYSNFKKLIKRYGKTNKQIVEEIKLFTHVIGKEYPEECSCGERYTCYHCQEISEYNNFDNNIQFYGYYSAYDHVALCWLFGKMIDLPESFPMYTIDLKQMLDEKVNSLTYEQLNKLECPNCIHDILSYLRDNGKITTDFRLKLVKEKHPNYPKQINEHNALYDAKWNKQLHEFLKSL